MTIRTATHDDDDAIWRILQPVIRAGETLCLPRDMSREALLEYWFAPPHRVFVALVGSMGNGEWNSPLQQIVGTYFLHANQMGGGSHIANCGYVTDPTVTGKGIARAMCLHSLETAKQQGFKGMQFNIVVSTNAPAVHLWQTLGFEVIGTTPSGFHHPNQGYVDTLIMYRRL